MNRKLGIALKMFAFSAFAAVVVIGTKVEAKGKPGGDDGCPRLIFCPLVYDPVICDDGNTYSNSCFAYAACATGCESTGEGGPVPF